MVSPQNKPNTEYSEKHSTSSQQLVFQKTKGDFQKKKLRQRRRRLRRRVLFKQQLLPEEDNRAAGAQCPGCTAPVVRPSPRFLASEPVAKTFSPCQAFEASWFTEVSSWFPYQPRGLSETREWAEDTLLLRGNEREAKTPGENNRDLT